MAKTQFNLTEKGHIICSATGQPTNVRPEQVKAWNKMAREAAAALNDGNVMLYSSYLRRLSDAAQCHSLPHFD